MSFFACLLHNAQKRFSLNRESNFLVSTGETVVWNVSEVIVLCWLVLLRFTNLSTSTVILYKESEPQSHCVYFFIPSIGMGKELYLILSRSHKTPQVWHVEKLEAAVPKLWPFLI